MKRSSWVRIGIATLVALALLGVGIGLSFARLDAGAIREALGARLEAALAQPISLGAVELSLLPLPALQVRDVRVGDPASPRLEADSMRIGVSPLPLVFGELVLRTIELERPRVRWPVAAASGFVPTSWKETSDAPVLRIAITNLVARDGALELGSERLDHLELSGGIGLTLGAGFDFSAESPGGGRIEAGRIELSGLMETPSAWEWTASAALAGLDLSALRTRLNMSALWGMAGGSLRARGRGALVETATLELESKDCDLRGEQLRAWGTMRLRAELEGRVELDLDDAQLAAGELVAKPMGVALRISAALPEHLSERRLVDLRIESDALRARGEIDLEPAARIELREAVVDLAALAEWGVPEWAPRAGRLELERVLLASDPPSVELTGAASAVRIPVPVASRPLASVSGAVWANDGLVGGDLLRIELAGEAVTASLRYEWRARRMELVTSAEGARLGPLAEALTERSDFGGRLYGKVELTGPLDPFGMAGKGELELVDGSLPGVPLARIANPQPGEEQRPDLGRMERARVRFVVARDEVEISELVLEQSDARATLDGRLWLRDWSADLSGELILDSYELAAPEAIPILKIGGRLGQMTAAISRAQTPEQRDLEKRMIEEVRAAARAKRELERKRVSDRPAR